MDATRIGYLIKVNTFQNATCSHVRKGQCAPFPVLQIKFHPTCTGVLLRGKGLETPQTAIGLDLLGSTFLLPRQSGRQ